MHAHRVCLSTIAITWEHLVRGIQLRVHADMSVVQVPSLGVRHAMLRRACVMLRIRTAFIPRQIASVATSLPRARQQAVIAHIVYQLMIACTVKVTVNGIRSITHAATAV